MVWYAKRLASSLRCGRSGMRPTRPDATAPVEYGYWASACAGNVTYWVLIMSTAGAIAPALGHGDTLLAIALSSVGVWLFFYFIRRGVKDAAIINRIVTIAKIVPILLFILLALFALDPQAFADNIRGDGAT